MFNNIKKPIAPRAAVGAVVLATAACLLSNPSFAEKRNATIKNFSFSASQLNSHQAINIISTDGERWNAIEPSNVQLKINTNMDLRGLVLSSGIFLGLCEKTSCGGNPLLKARPSMPFSPTTLYTDKIPVSGAGIATLPYGDKMIEACNQYLNDGPSEAHGFTWPITVTLSVDTRRWKPKYRPSTNLETYGGGDVSRQSTFRVKVNCIPYATMIRGAAPVEVKLIVEPREGNSCPRNTKIKTRIVYHYKKTATFNIRRNGKTIKTVKIKAKRVKLSHGPDQWVINREDIVEAEAGQNRFRIKVKGGGKSQIRTANIECAPFQVMFAKLQYDVVGSSTCPKKVWETVTFTANGPGNLVYQLVRKFNGTVAREKSLTPILKNGVYKLVGQRVLTIHKSVDREFRVQVKGQSGNRSPWARLKVQCPQNSKGVSGIKTTPKPTHSKRVKPQIKTAPLPKKRKRKLTNITCKKGKVRVGKCYCGVKRKRVRTGKRSFICKIKPRIKTALLRKKNKATRIGCRGGVVKANRCACPKRTRRISLGGHKYRCVRKITKPKKNQGALRVNPRKRKAGRNCGARKVFVRGRCIRPAS